jgi:hypothetical protein
MEKAVEGGAEFIAAQQAKVAADLAAEDARAAAVQQGYPRVLTSGGAQDTEWVYPSEVTLGFDTETDALAAVEAARAEGRHVSSFDGGDFVIEDGGEWKAAIELDKSTRYPLADHTGGR